MTLHALGLSYSRMLPYALARPDVCTASRATPDRLKQEHIVYIARPLPSAIVIIITSTKNPILILFLIPQRS